MNFELRQTFYIESARSLPHLPPSHPCSRIHGHSFKIVLLLVGPLDPKIGWVQDYNEIDQKIKPILSQLDHRLLNEVPGLENPTSELIAKWIFEHAKPVLPLLKRISISETLNSECSYPA